MIALGIVLGLIQLVWWVLLTLASMVTFQWPGEPPPPPSPYTFPLQIGLLVNVVVLVIAFGTWRARGWWLFVVLQLADLAAYVAVREMASDTWTVVLGPVLALGSAGSVLAARYWVRP